MKFEKKVNGIGVMRGVFNEYGELKGHKVLFYVWFNDVELME